MARTNGSKDNEYIDRTVDRLAFEHWPLYTQFEFEDWVQEIIDGQPVDEEDREDVVPEIQREPTDSLGRRNACGCKGKGEVKIDGKIYPNVFQACKILGISNTLIYKWLREGKAVRLSEHED